MSPAGEGDRTRAGTDSLAGTVGGPSARLVKPPETVGDLAGRLNCSHSCHNKQPHPRGLGITETRARTMLGARSQQAWAGNALLSLVAQKGSVAGPGPSFRRCRPPPALPGPQTHCWAQVSAGDLWHGLHGVPLPLSPSEEDTGHLGSRAPSFTPWELIVTRHTYKSSISHRDCIMRFRVDVNGGAVLTPVQRGRSGSGRD